MNQWLLLALLFWVLAIGSYIIKNKNNTIFSFFDGLLLAFLCFKFLPQAFLQGNFWKAVAGLLLGVLIGFIVEQYSRLQIVLKSPLLHSTIFSTATLFFCNGIKSCANYSNTFGFLLVLMGGLFLCISCSGILPESDNSKEKAIAGIFGAIGFMLGSI